MRGRRPCGAAKPIAGPHLLGRINNDIAYANIELELHEGTPRHHRLDRVTGASVRRTIEIGRGLTYPEAEPIAFSSTDLLMVVGAAVFEPAISWSRTRRSQRDLTDYGATTCLEDMDSNSRDG